MASLSHLVGSCSAPSESVILLRHTTIVILRTGPTPFPKRLLRLACGQFAFLASWRVVDLWLAARSPPIPPKSVGFRLLVDSETLRRSSIFTGRHRLGFETHVHPATFCFYVETQSANPMRQ